MANLKISLHFPGRYKNQLYFTYKFYFDEIIFHNKTIIYKTTSKKIDCIDKSIFHENDFALKTSFSQRFVFSGRYSLITIFKRSLLTNIYVLDVTVTQLDFLFCIIKQHITKQLNRKITVTWKYTYSKIKGMRYIPLQREISENCYSLSSEMHKHVFEKETTYNSFNNNNIKVLNIYNEVIQ